MPAPETNPELRTAEVGSMFDRTAARYDLLNSLLSWGRDQSWREAMAASLSPGQRVLDLCCGSARSAVPVHRQCRREVVGVDISTAMLARGRHHARRADVRFAPVRGDALRLPFADETFDAVTVAWGLRNLRPEADALEEIRRVLRPGGSLLVLDSPSPEPGPVGAMHRLYLRLAVPALGLLSSDPKAYAYLARTVLAYGTRREVADRLQRAGFQVRRLRVLLHGAAVLWESRKPAPAPRPDGGLQVATPRQNAVAGTSGR